MTLLAAATAALLTAGCAAAQKPAQTLTTPPSSAPSSASTGAASTDLSKALLAVTDLPAGWTTDELSSGGTGDASCPALNSGPWKHLPQEAEADFSDGQTGPFLLDQLAGGSAAQASAALQSFVKATSQCAHFTQEASGGTNTFKLSAMSFPSYGDATYAFAVTVSQSLGLSASGDIVVVRKGGILVEITVFGLESVPVSLVEQLVTKALAKV